MTYFDARDDIRREWDNWRAGWNEYHLCDRAVCPSCFETAELADAQFMAKTHANWRARHRWRGHAARHRRRLSALGPCRCDAKITTAEARRRAVEKLGNLSCLAADRLERAVTAAHYGDR